MKKRAIKSKEIVRGIRIIRFTQKPDDTKESTHKIIMGPLPNRLRARGGIKRGKEEKVQKHMKVYESRDM